MAKLVREYRRRGWTIERTNGQHFKWVPPNGAEIFYTSSTPSDYRSYANVQAHIKRAQSASRVAL
jgi:hypothetical protein